MSSVFDYNEKFGKICRICLQSHENMKPLFKPEILNMLSICSKISMNENDGFPNQICTICYENAMNAYNFHKLCENSDQILRQSHRDKIKETHCKDINVQKTIEFNSMQENLKEEFFDGTEPESISIDKHESCLICPECGKQFRFPCEVSRHRWTHKDPSFQCKQCQKKFKMKDWLDRHMKICHSGDRPLQICKICGKSVLHLEQHNLIHNNETFTCTVCTIEFTNKCALRAHITRKHGKNMDMKQYKPYLCSICGINTYTITALKSHMTSHCTERKYVCDQCTRKFKTEHHLNKHIKFTHNAIKTVQCHICSKSFCSRTVLKLHLRVHTGERPYQCHICTKAFSQTSSLRTHMKIHGLSSTSHHHHHTNPTIGGTAGV